MEVDVDWETLGEVNARWSVGACFQGCAVAGSDAVVPYLDLGSEALWMSVSLDGIIGACSCLLASGVCQ